MTTLGDMISGGAAGVPTRVPVPSSSTANQLLTSSGAGSSPTWKPLLNVTGAIAVGLSGFSWSQLNPGTDGSVLTLSGGTPAWAVPEVLSVYLSADKAVPATVYTNIVFDTVYINNFSGSFSAATGIFTVPVAGNYRVTVHAAFVSANVGIQAMHNGTQVSFSPGAAINPAWGLYMAETTVLRSCVVGDTLSADSYSTPTNTVKGSPSLTFMHIELVK